MIVIARSFWRTIDGIIEGVSGRSRSGRRSAAPQGTKLVRDPVCGTYVVPNEALALTTHASTLYFCSDACRTKYQARARA